MDMSYLLYMAEQEGQLDTKWSKIQRAIAEAPPGATIQEACQLVGISQYDLTLSEINYMEKAGFKNC
jgi:hypothetical protein